MTRVLRVLVPVLAFAMPIVLGSYHSARNFGAWNNFDVRYSPLWLIGYGLAFAVSAFIFGVPGLVHRADQVVLASLLATMAPLALASVVFVVWNPYIPRLVVVGTPTFLFVGFALLSLLHGALHQRGEGHDRVLFVIGPDELAELEGEMGYQPERRFSIAAVLDPAEAESEAVFANTVTGTSANVIVLGASAQFAEPIVANAARLHERGMRVRSVMGFYEEWLGKLPIGDLERSSLWFDIRDVHELQYTRVKRVMDLAITAVLLPVFVVSIPFVVLGNLIANRGPLFFKQARVGQHDQVFTMWKYRTMTVNAAAGGAGQWTASDDPRITAFGRLLRVTHLDELPQVINVALGQLSVVGPRPEQVHYVQELNLKIPFYTLRHVVKPGITGWAQVKYPYGASERDALEKLQYELFYLKHQGPSLDVRVCVRTVRSMLMRGGR